MTTYNVVSPGSMQAGQPEDVSQVLANFQAIAAVLNGSVDGANLSPTAALAIASLVTTGNVTANGLIIPSTGLVLPAVSSTPPASPVDGQIWLWQPDATNGYMWAFRYRAASASAYKWEFVGGAPWFAADDTPVTNSGGWTLIGPYLPSLRPGEYSVKVSAEHVQFGAGAGFNITWSTGITANGNVVSGYYTTAFNSGGGGTLGPYKHWLVEGLAVIPSGGYIGLTGDAQQWSSQMRYRRVTIQPVRVS